MATDIGRAAKMHDTTRYLGHMPKVELVRKIFRQITRRYKTAQISFLEELASIATTNDSIPVITNLVYRAAEKFSATRAVIFRRTAQDYEQLLSRGIRHYRPDLINFINQWQSVPSFGSDVSPTSDESST
jgi:hypothetical protein